MRQQITHPDKPSGSTDAETNRDESVPQWARPVVITRSDGNTVTGVDHVVADPVLKLRARINEQPTKIPLVNIDRIDPLPRGGV